MTIDLSIGLNTLCLIAIAYATLKTGGVLAKGVNEVITGLQAIHDKLDRN